MVSSSDDDDDDDDDGIAGLVLRIPDIEKK